MGEKSKPCLRYGAMELLSTEYIHSRAFDAFQSRMEDSIDPGNQSFMYNMTFTPSLHEILYPLPCYRVNS